jgi:hypothetical protein
MPASPSHGCAVGPSLSALKGGEGVWAGAEVNVATMRCCQFSGTVACVVKVKPGMMPVIVAPGTDIDPAV